MKKILIGFIFGFLLSLVVTAKAAELLGGGYLMGWDVKIHGHKICSDPFIWGDGMNEIECD